jgi:hypothetical protein
MFDPRAYRDCMGRPSERPHVSDRPLPVDLQWAYVHQVCPEGCAHQKLGCTTMAHAIERYDPFNAEAYWPLRNVIPYLGRMGVD